jgi:hypothetical protein
VTFYETIIFVNCPFDKPYRPLLDALLFSLVYLGFKPRISSESSDSLKVRLEKIKNLIKASRYSIHDISRMEAKKKGDLSRFNMPFELGIDLGCRTYGGRILHGKKCLILEKKLYRFAKSLSDLAGVDIRAHKEDPEEMVHHVRHWICNNIKKEVESGTKVWRAFIVFSGDFKEDMKVKGFKKKDIDKMEPGEYIHRIQKWMKGK